MTISPATFQRYATDPEAFRRDLLIDVDGSVRKFGDVQDDWQRSDFLSLDPALLRVTGRSNDDAKMRAFLERPRGHSKTQDLAIISSAALAFATRPLRGYCFATDQQQANLLKDAIARIVRLNPWLATIISVQRDGVVNIADKHPGKGSKLEIFTSDVGSSYGILPDLIVADELCNWSGDGSLWDSLLSSAAKKRNCLLVIISNAGFCDSWQWKIREAARTDDAWIFSRLEGPRASWLDEKRLEEQRRMLPQIAFSRLWENCWSSGGGDCLLPSDVAIAFKSDLQPMTGNEPDFNFVAGVDLGLTRDCSAVVTLGIGKFGSPQAGKIQLANHKLWIPKPGYKINLTDIENYINELDQQYNLQTVGFDPWQAEHLAQRLEANAKHRRRQQRLFRAKPWMQEVPPTGTNLRETASLLIESFQDFRLHLYPCEPLRRDLLKLRVEEKSYGFRLTSPRDETGHGDSVSAFGLALLVGHAEAGKKRFAAGALEPEQTLTAFQRGIRELQENQEYHQEQQAYLSQPEASSDVWRAIAYAHGRTNDPGSESLQRAIDRLQ